MRQPAQLIFQTHDLYGEIGVYDHGKERLLVFEGTAEQSAMLRSDPTHLLYAYHQAMLLSLLLAPSQQILCLGLGAGSLVNTLYRHCPEAQLTVVELRQSVITLAQRYFALPQGPRLRIHCDQAGAFLAQHPGRYDLIFSDLHLSQGPVPVQQEAPFLQQCARQLAPEGMLVLNCWLEQLKDADFLTTLQRCFAQVWCCLTDSGNCLLFASQTAWEPQRVFLPYRARSWSERLGFSLLPHLKRLVPLNDISPEDRLLIASFQKR